MKKLLITLGLALGLILPAAATVSASESPGRPGRYEMSVIGIGFQGAGYGQYTAPVAGNTFVTVFDETIRVVENANFVLVNCTGPDASGVYETNAEVGYTSNCQYDGMTGTGTVTRANNGDGDGGQNVTFRCKFAK